MLKHHTLAYKYLIGVAQSQNFGDEILSLQKGKEILPSSPLKTLFPIVNWKFNSAPKVGFLRKETARHPLIFDGVNPIVMLLFKNTHVVKSHSGVKQTRSFLMEYYWFWNAELLLDKQYVSANLDFPWLSCVTEVCAGNFYKTLHRLATNQKGLYETAGEKSFEYILVPVHADWCQNFI